MSEYEKQGLDFLQKTGVTMDVKFSTHGKHFDDDKEPRDIYDVTLSRGRAKISIRFGQSINNSLYENERFFDKGKMKGSRKRIPPTAYDVLTCLTKYNPGTFEDFASEFGYDNDSRRAERTYNAVVQEWLSVSAFFTQEEIAALQEIV